jgi:hypothetical protein
MAGNDPNERESRRASVEAKVKLQFPGVELVRFHSSAPYVLVAPFGTRKGEPDSQWLRLTGDLPHYLAGEFPVEDVPEITYVPADPPTEPEGEGS